MAAFTSGARLGGPPSYAPFGFFFLPDFFMNNNNNNNNNNDNNLLCGNPKPMAIGHTRTRLQPESGGRHYAQSAAPSTGKRLTLLNMVLYPLLDICGGASFVNRSEFQEDFWVAPVIGISGVATTGRIWAESRKIPIVIWGIRTGDLAISNDVA